MNDAHSEEMRELLLPYALGQLSVTEREQLEVALDADPDLRRELEAIEELGARILADVPRVAAPAALRTRVLDAVSPGADRPVSESAAAPVASLDVARTRRRRLLPGAIAGSLVAACLVLAVVAVDLSRDLDVARDRADRLAQVAAERPGPPQGFEGSTTHPVSTTGEFADAHGSLVRISDKQWILLLRNVPSPGIGKSWQVWTLDSNGLVENVAQWVKGDSTRMIVLDRSDIKEVMVSFEPSTRPVPVPSSAPVADVKV